METSFLHSMNLVFCFSRKYQTRQNHMKIIFLVFVFPSDFFIFHETIHVNANIIFFSSAYYNIYCNYVLQGFLFKPFFLILIFWKAAQAHIQSSLFILQPLLSKKIVVLLDIERKSFRKISFLEFNHAVASP